MLFISNLPYLMNCTFQTSFTMGIPVKKIPIKVLIFIINILFMVF